MLKHWYVYIFIAIVYELLIWVCDRYNIIRNKILRWFILFFVASFLMWLTFDVIIGEE